MPTQNAKASPSSPDHPSGKDEIEQIMDEIEQLQKEIDSTELSPVPTKAAAAAPAPRASAASAPAPEMPHGAPAPVGAELSQELKELGFGMSGEAEGSLEDTLGALEEEPSSGNGALDEMEAIAGSLSADEEIVEEEDIEEETQASQPISSAPSPSEEDEEEEISEPEENPMTTTGHMKDTADSNEGCLTMTLKGNMTLKLQYDFDGQCVAVGFSDGALKIELADGTEFKIPVHGRRGPGQIRRVA